MLERRDGFVASRKDFTSSGEREEGCGYTGEMI
jgi:hypothetical protein